MLAKKCCDYAEKLAKLNEENDKIISHNDSLVVLLDEQKMDTYKHKISTFNNK